MNSFFEYDFLTRALLAGLALGVACGLLSPWVVLRRLSFSADGLAHSSLGGLALGVVLLRSGPVPTLAGYGISFLFTCGVALLIAYIAGKNWLQSDTAVGACYVAAFALGVLLLSLQRRSGHLEHFLFGSLLSVTPLEVQLLTGLVGLTALANYCGWRWLGSWTFDEELARAGRVPTAVLRYGLMLLIAATVILATWIVGILLVTALLILPGATGVLAGRTLRGIAALSVSAAVGAVLAGMAVSNQVDVPPGPTIVLSAFTVFAVAFGWRRWRDARRASEQNFSTPDSHVH